MLYNQRKSQKDWVTAIAIFANDQYCKYGGEYMDAMVCYSTP